MTSLKTMIKPIQYDHIKGRCRAYNVNGVCWGKEGSISFVIGLDKFSTEESHGARHYTVHGTTELEFSFSTIKSKKKFGSQFYTRFMRGAQGGLNKTGTPAAEITAAFRDKENHINKEEFILIPEVADCLERIRSQVKGIEKDLREERGERRVQELKANFKSDVRSFVRKFGLSRNEINTVIHDCLKEMEIEDVMKT